jgi:argininosuccinate synthase
MTKLLLAFSGGLDTSFCALWLQEQGYEVHTATIDTGGFSSAELARIEAQAAKLGVASHRTVDGRQRLWDRYLRFLVYGNVLRGQAYPLSVSAERVCQAELAVAAARELGATALAHGSTGAGNDQVRFDVAFAALAPDLAVRTPIRELALSRVQEVEWLEGRGFTFPPKTAAYSVNEGMWGTSIGGRETLNPWDALPAEAWPGGEVDASLPARELVIGFAEGVPASLDGEALDPVVLIARLNDLGRSYGVGRAYHLGDTILGIKGRIGFEAPAALMLLQAHRELEKLTLSGKQLFWKESLGNLYGSLLHEGHFFDPLARDLEAFLQRSQAVVTGDVRLVLRPHGFQTIGARSPFALMNDLAAYGEGTKLWTGADAAGFAKVFGVSQRLTAMAQGTPFEHAY